MKTAAIPAVRVSAELRQAAEAVRETGAILSGFVEDAVLGKPARRQRQVDHH